MKSYCVTAPEASQLRNSSQTPRQLNQDTFLYAPRITREPMTHSHSTRRGAGFESGSSSLGRNVG